MPRLGRLLPSSNMLMVSTKTLYAFAEGFAIPLGLFAVPAINTWAIDFGISFSIVLAIAVGAGLVNALLSSIYALKRSAYQNKLNKILKGTLSDSENLIEENAVRLVAVIKSFEKTWELREPHHKRNKTMFPTVQKNREQAFIFKLIKEINKDKILRGELEEVCSKSEMIDKKTLKAYLDTPDTDTELGRLKKAPELVYKTNIGRAVATQTFKGGKAFAGGFLLAIGIMSASGAAVTVAMPMLAIPLLTGLLAMITKSLVDSPLETRIDFIKSELNKYLPQKVRHEELIKILIEKEATYKDAIPNLQEMKASQSRRTKKPKHAGIKFGHLFRRTKAEVTLSSDKQSSTEHLLGGGGTNALR